MKILFCIEASAMEQDAFHQDRLLIEHCTFSIDNMEELKNVLINSVIYNLHEDHYFNVRLWIPVLNVLDDALLTLLKWMFRESDGIQNDEWYKALVPGSAEHIQYFEVKSLLEVIISWTSKLISHSYNNNVYNSAEHIVHILKFTSHADLAVAALDVLSSLAQPPPNHRNVFTYGHTTALHKNTDFTLPLFDIMLAGTNLAAFTAESIASGTAAETADTAEVDSAGRSRPKWWYQLMASSVRSDSNNDRWDMYRCFLKAFAVLVRTHKELADVTNFFRHKPQIQNDLAFLLRSASGDDNRNSNIPFDVRSQAVQCVTALLERSEAHHANLEKEGEIVGVVRLLAPFDSILQGQLGLDGVQIQGLLPSLMRQQLHWLATLDKGATGVASADRAAPSREELSGTLDRLRLAETLFLCALVSLPLPKAIQAFVNNGLIDGLLAVIRRHDLTDLRTLAANHRYNNSNSSNSGSGSNGLRQSDPALRALVFSVQWQAFNVVSLLVQVQDMILSAKRAAMEAFYAANGPMAVLERLKHESTSIDAATVAAYVAQQKACGNRYPVSVNSAIPVCCQSTVLSLVAVLDALLNNHNNREVRSGSHATLNQMELVRSGVFGEVVVSLCDGIASVCTPVLHTLVRLLCELINNDSATPAVINLFLLSPPFIIKKAYQAVSSPHIRHDIESVNSVLNLMTALSMKEEGTKLIAATNPFAVILNIFKDPFYLLSESMLLHPSFAVQIGTQFGELLRSYPLYSNLFATTLVQVMEAVLVIATVYRRTLDMRQDGVAEKTLGGDYSAQEGLSQYSDVILSNMMISVLLLCGNVAERSSPFCKEFMALQGTKTLFGFATQMFGSRRFQLTTLASKIGVTADDKPGHNQLRRILLHATFKILTHQPEGIVTDLSRRIQAECDDLAGYLAVYHAAVCPGSEMLDGAEEHADHEEDGDAMEEEEEEGRRSSAAENKFNNVFPVKKMTATTSSSSSSSSSKGEKGEKKKADKKKGDKGDKSDGVARSIKALRAKNAQKGANKATKAVAAAVSARSAGHFDLHRILGALSDSTEDLFAFDYSAHDQLFDVLQSLLRVEGLCSLLADTVEYATNQNIHIHAHLAHMIPSVASAALVNASCVREIARAHEAVVVSHLGGGGAAGGGSGDDAVLQRDVAVEFDVYLLPGKQKTRVRDNVSGLEADGSRNRAVTAAAASGSTRIALDSNCYVRASGRVCSEESKSLTYFRLEGGGELFVRRREIDGVPNMEVTAIRRKKKEPTAVATEEGAMDVVAPSSSNGEYAMTSYRRDQSISLYRVGKNVLRAVCNSFNSLVAVLLPVFKTESDSAVFRGLLQVLMPSLMDQTFRAILQAPPLNGGHNGREASVVTVDRCLRFKYVVDTCSHFLSLKAFSDHNSSSSLSLSGNPLALASLYQHDDGELFSLVIQSCCAAVTGCFPAEGAAAAGVDPLLNTHERVFCLSVTARVLTFLKSVLHCLGFQDTAWGKELSNKHKFPKPYVIKYNCFIRLYEHLCTVWKHPLLHTLPAHMCLSVAELLSQFQECGHKMYVSCCSFSEDAELAQQLSYLQALGANTEEDSCRMFLRLVQFGGMHFEEKSTAAGRAHDCSVSPKLWPLNVTAAGAGIKRADFLLKLVEQHVRGMTNQISLTNKKYRCDTNLHLEVRNVDRGVHASIEKQYKVTVSMLSVLFSHLVVTLQKNTDSGSGLQSDVDFQALEGLLHAANTLLYTCGSLNLNVCPPFQNATTLLLAVIPEFNAVYLDIAGMLSREVALRQSQAAADEDVFQQPGAKWILQAMVFVDSAIQPFLLSPALIAYCEVFSKRVASAVKLYHAAHLAQFDCSDLVCNAIDDGVIAALLLTTPMQMFYAGDRKKCCTYPELVRAVEDKSSVNAQVESPVAQLRSAVSGGLVQTCVRVLHTVSANRATATAYSPVLVQACLQVLSHAGRDTVGAEAILKTENLSTILGTAVGFQRLSVYLTTVVQTAVEQVSGDVLRVKMRRTIVAAAEALLETELQNGAGEARLRNRLAKNIGKFMTTLEPLAMRDPNLFLSIITDADLAALIADPASYVDRPTDLPRASAASSADTHLWAPVLDRVSQVILAQIVSMHRGIQAQRGASTPLTAAEGEALDDSVAVLGDLLVSVAELIHSLAPEQSEYLLGCLSASVTANHSGSGDTAQEVDLLCLLLDEVLPLYCVAVDPVSGAMLGTTLTWPRKVQDSKDVTTEFVGRTKVYVSAQYLLMALSAVEGSTRRSTLGQLSRRIHSAAKTLADSGEAAAVQSATKTAVMAADFVNALMVPDYNLLLSGLTFIVPTDSILAALTVLGVNTDLLQLQQAVTSGTGPHSSLQHVLAQSLAAAVNPLLLKGSSAVNGLQRFVARCKDLAAVDASTSSSSSSSSSSSEPPAAPAFWDNELHRFTNVYAVAAKANKQADRLSKDQPSKPAAAGSNARLTTDALASAASDARGIFDNMMTNFFSGASTTGGSALGSVLGRLQPPVAVRIDRRGTGGSGSGDGDDDGDVRHLPPDLEIELGDEDSLIGDDYGEDDHDHYGDMDEDEDDDGFGGAFGENFDEDDDDEDGHGSFIEDDEDDDEDGMGGGRGAGTMWGEVGPHGDVRLFQEWGGDDGRDGGSDMSMGSDGDDEEGDEDDDDMDGMGEDGFDDFDLFSAPPDSDDDDDSEMNEAVVDEDDGTVDNSTIYIDESSQRPDGDARGGNGQRSAADVLLSKLRVHSDVYHLLGYLNEGGGDLDGRSLFTEMLGPLLPGGDKKEAMYGRTDFRHVLQAGVQGRVSLHCPSLSRRVWGADLDSSSSILTSVVLMPFVTYLILKPEFASRCNLTPLLTIADADGAAESAAAATAAAVTETTSNSASGAAAVVATSAAGSPTKAKAGGDSKKDTTDWSSASCFSALEFVLNTLDAASKAEKAVTDALKKGAAYSHAVAARRLAECLSVSGSQEMNAVVWATPASDISVPSVGEMVVSSFVGSVAQYLSQRHLVRVNFNRQLNLQSMSLYKLCLATQQVLRNNQMALLSMFTAPERTPEWDRGLFQELSALLRGQDAGADTGAVGERVTLLFEVIAYQCDEMYRKADHGQLALRHALLAPPPTATAPTELVVAATDADASLSTIQEEPADVCDVSVMMTDEAESSPQQQQQSSSSSSADCTFGAMLDALRDEIRSDLPSSAAKDLLRVLSHVLRLCEKERNSVPIKVSDANPLHLFVPTVGAETIAGLVGLFLRADMFVSAEHYVVHFTKLLNFLCQNKANWAATVACMKGVGETLMSEVAADTKTMLSTTRKAVTATASDVEGAVAQTPVKGRASRSPVNIGSHTASAGASSSASSSDSTSTNKSTTAEGDLPASKSVREAIQFVAPNAELRLVYFFDLLQSATKAMNTCGVQHKKRTGTKEEQAAAASEPPALNGTTEDYHLLTDALIHLQESVAWEHLVEILRHLNTVVEGAKEEEAPAADGAPALADKKPKMSAYGSIASEHQRMIPLVECLFQVATMPTVLFNHIPAASQQSSASGNGADGKLVVMDTAVKSTVSKTPAIFKDVSLSGTKLGKNGRDAASAKHSIKLFDCYVTHKLFTVVEENKRLLNTKLNQNIRLLEQSLQAMRTVPELSKFLDFSVKRKYLRLQIKRLRRPMRFRDMTEEQRIAENIEDSDDEGDDGEGAAEDDEADNISVMVDRDDVLNQSFHMVSNYTPRQLLRGSFHVTFNNEPGMDAGGLTREWLLILTRSIFKPAYALFSLSADGVTYQPNPHSGANPEHLDYFRFIGRLVAKAICDNVLLDVHFTRSFYKHILRVPISFSDLEAFDKEYYKSLNMLLQHSLEDLGVELTFTATANVFGTEVTNSLIPDGENVAVTDENKAEYVRLIAHHCLTTSFQKQIDAFLEGFHELLPHSLFGHFDPSELELLISGLPEVDVEDLFAHTTYTGYKPGDQVIQWFWAVLRKFSNEEKALFVQFVTGTSKVPLDGFQSLQGSEGVQLFSVHKAYNAALLPTAHTCFNQLDLPEYPSEEVLRDKLVLAIRECSEGFGFQ